MPVIERVQSLRSERRSLFDVLAYVGAITSGLLAAASITRFLAVHIGHDQAWGLYAAAQVLHGVELNGPFLVETNPPFFVWFMALPVLLAKLLRLGEIDGFRCFFLALAAIFIAWSTRLFHRLYRPPAFVLWSLVAMECSLVSLLIDIDNFGQREHIAAFFLLPYLLAAAFRLQNKPLASFESALIGLAAAIALCLKPQHAFDLFLVEVLILYRVRRFSRWLHVSSIVLLVGAAAYVLAVRLAAPSYFTQIVPLLKSTYWGFNEAYRLVLLYAVPYLEALACDLAIYALLRRRLRYEALEAVLLTASVGALMAYLQQHKGWSYQQIPLRCFVWIALTLLLADAAYLLIHKAREHRSRWSGSQMGAALLSLGVGLVVCRHFMRPIGYAEPEKQIIADLLRAYPAGTAMTYISRNPWAFPALLEQHKVLGTRYVHLWMLPAIIRSQDPLDLAVAYHLPSGEIERLSKLLRSNEAEDLAHFQPALVMVDSCAMRQFCDPSQQGRFGSVLDWFLADSAFRAEWLRYRHQETISGLEVYKRLP